MSHVRPYESGLIGAFLFQVGATVGRRRSREQEAAFVAYLMGHTLEDQAYGDLVVGPDDHLCLIEFKRGREEFREEATKPARKHLLGALARPENHVFLETSRACHFLAYGELVTGDDPARLWLADYAGLQGCLERPYEFWGTGRRHVTFIEDLVPPVTESATATNDTVPPPTVGVAMPRFLKYLDLVIACTEAAAKHAGLAGTARYPESTMLLLQAGPRGLRGVLEVRLQHLRRLIGGHAYAPSAAASIAASPPTPTPDPLPVEASTTPAPPQPQPPTPKPARPPRR
jgi:hypothetical protein